MKNTASFISAFAMAYLIPQISSGAQLLTDSNNLNIGGKIVEQQMIAKNVELNRNQESDGFNIGVILQKSQRALFEMEVQDRSGWNNSNSYYCFVKDFGTKSDIGVRATLAVIDTSHFSNVKKTSGSSIPSSGQKSWALLANAKEGALGMYQITCGGHQWGQPTGSIFVRVKKTVYE